jgi:thiol-disulfide isomerase/thioredoxin
MIAASATASMPEFVGNESWLNTDRPLTLAGQRGRVVLVEFGTYTCINWRRTLPYVNCWYAEYGPQGLQIITVHTPEFGFERNRLYVETAIRDLNVRNPLAQDNGFETWRAFGNQAWPSFYLLDREGRIRLLREGEGHARELEAGIRSLLGLPRDPRDPATGDADLSRIRTPEMYFGSLHPTPQDPAQAPRQGEASYTIARAGGTLLNEYQLEGTWARDGEPLLLRSLRGLARIRFSAAKLHLVAGSPKPAPVRVTVDGGPPRSFEIGMPTLYTLLDGDRYGEHLLELKSETPGLALFSATFG